MYSLGIETSNKFLLLVLMNDEKVVDYIQMDCFKKQSEYIIVKIDELVKRNNLAINQIDNYIITKGPGSYTGVRIGMTVAKIIGSIANKNVYTLSTLQLYAGLEDCYVLMDGRAGRCYVGRYNQGMAINEDTIINNIEIENNILNKGVTVIGDLSVFNKEDRYDHLAENFFVLKQQWQKVDNIDILVPTYLKDKEDYLKI